MWINILVRMPRVYKCVNILVRMSRVYCPSLCWQGRDICRHLGMRCVPKCCSFISGIWEPGLRIPYPWNHLSSFIWSENTISIQVLFCKSQSRPWLGFPLAAAVKAVKCRWNSAHFGACCQGAPRFLELVKYHGINSCTSGICKAGLWFCTSDTKMFPTGYLHWNLY